jgi:teichuronic acid biosynthesis glycosyltransferase TuaH
MNDDEHDFEPGSRERRSGDLKGSRIVFLSHTAYGGPYRVGSHHLAGQLASRHGAEVVHVSTPISPLHYIRRRPGGNIAASRTNGRSFIDDRGVRHLAPLSISPIGRGPRVVERANTAVLMRQVAPLLTGTVDSVIVDQPLLWRLVPAIGARQVIYRPTDLASSRAIARAEVEMVRYADVLVTTTDTVLRGLPSSLQQLPHLLLPNGVDLTSFASVSDPAGRSGAIYIGAIDDRFDWECVAALARAAPDEVVKLYGPVSARPTTPLPANVRLLGPIPYEQMPALLVQSRVGLLPFSDAPWNAGRSPMKLYEYLAAGLQVVGGNISHLSGQDAPGLHQYRSVADAGHQFRHALTLPVNEAGRARAASEDWSRKADQLLPLLAPARTGPRTAS